MLALWAGLLPIAVVNAAYLLNVHAGLEACFPYLEGCTSVSRGIRSGPGLWLFRVLAVPVALCMAGTWLSLPRRWRHGPLRWIGTTGAVFFVIYALTLGTDGEMYRWMRRYGVVLYFGLTGLAQIVLAGRLWSEERGSAGTPGRPRDVVAYLAVVVITWMIGVASAFKRQLFEDPQIVDRLQNALEWNFALALSLAFLALVPVLRRAA